MSHPCVLFVSEKNAVRSQIAAALLRHYGEGRYDVYCTGTDSLYVAAEALEVLREQGIRVDAPSVRAPSEFDTISFDYVINICDGDHTMNSLVLGASETMTWHFDDPASDADRTNGLRRLRDEILNRIRYFILTDRRFV